MFLKFGIKLKLFEGTTYSQSEEIVLYMFLTLHLSAEPSFTITYITDFTFLINKTKSVLFKETNFEKKKTYFISLDLKKIITYIFGLVLRQIL